MIFVFDGLDGCGKSTYIKRLQDVYEAQGKKVKVFRNPGGTQYGEFIRDMVKGKEVKRQPLTDLVCLAANWMEIIKETETFVKEGYVVLIDRGPMSAYAYQGEMKGLTRQVEILYDFLVPLYLDLEKTSVPRVLFYIDVPYELLVDRLKDRPEVDGEMYEGRSLEWYTTLKVGYDRFYQDDVHRRGFSAQLSRLGEDKYFEGKPLFGRILKVNPTDNTKHEHNRLLGIFKETIDKEMGWSHVD